ncbi:N-acetylmuramoyl-L-alanine amidase [Fictibacillus phosphorivorans]|uniref:N-acetylmuramoyl-L-alanine amidase n=1 Tax=Fictibacillus phosphorivorans TaxID=1221500 RepID=UPI00203FF9A7|nr:N-acetylmuramoyl-L-alanine amidase [Fictibacillus phosphorivorans]MCM3719662.1 N-acetylmuramoyl-L-alanine amidase [Fictibacillus phosphorivorans]MCM3777353.1 N-acetylmuramoyl-L-alanine amidase [Fictibacillus phosphorivorans]
MKVVIIDPGHGGNDPGAVNQGSFEKTYNLAIAKKIQAYLQNNYEVKVLMTRSSDTTVSLKERTDFANNQKADFFLSIHQNSGGGEGFESYVYPNVGAETKKMQNTIHARTAEVMRKYGARDRGKKQANFHVLRETKMPAVLLEVLFIDNVANLALLNRTDFQNEVSAAIATGVAEGLSLKQKQQEPKNLFIAIAGAFEQRKNAEARVQFLADKKISAFIDEVVINNKKYYRVQAGAFQKRENAETHIVKIRALGIKDAYVMVKAEGGSVPEPPKPIPPSGLTIQGPTLLLADELERFVSKINPNAPRLAALYVQIGQVYGIRGDVAYAQAVHETGYFRFQGSVKASQNNFAGIGATGKEEAATFKTPEVGVLAHIQHLYAYSSTEALPKEYPLVDPRFNLVQRGSAKTWNQLNGKWAVPGTNYSNMILGIYKSMLNDAKGTIEQRINQIDKQLKEI